MSQTNPEVEQFIASVGQRVNRHRSFSVAFWAMIVGGAVMLAIAICYVLPGARVPWYWYPAVLAATVVGAFCADWFLKSNDEDAALFADGFFGMKNSVRSWLGFTREDKQGGFYELQSAHTATLVQQADVSDIRYKTPWKLVAPGVALVAASALLGFKPESPFRIAEREQQENTLAMTETANREIKELLDELEKSVDDENEKLMLEPDKLRQWVDELKETTDLHEAKRQYAKMEMRLNKAYEALEQRKDEQLLDKAAKELRKDFDSQELSKNLEHKKYKRAADDLEDLEPGTKNDQKLDPKKLSESRKELAKLKAAAKRMAAAARDTKGEDESGEGEEGEESDGDLAELLEDLEEAIEAYDEDLEEIELQDGESDQDLERYQDDLEESQYGMKSKLDDLGEHLKKMASRRGARSKLRRLSKKFSQAQSSQQRKGRGGKKAGEGSEESSRDQRDERVDNGQNTKLKGIKGSGPSITQIQAADDGDGVSRLRSKATKREFKQQFESFVDREDIPDDLRSGVKNYFNNIHEFQEQGNDSTDDTSSIGTLEP